VTDDADIARVEQMLQRTPAPESVPGALAEVARRAALGSPAAVTHAPRRRRLPGWLRIAAPAAAFGAAAAAAVAVAVGSSGGGFASQHTVALQGVNGASAVVDFGKPVDGVRQMVVHVSGLRPARAGQYYEMWFRTPSGDHVSAVTFNTADRGTATIRSVIPAGMSWRNCWVTREKAGQPGDITVLST
jgi:hypothetical protein